MLERSSVIHGANYTIFLRLVAEGNRANLGNLGSGYAVRLTDLENCPEPARHGRFQRLERKTLSIGVRGKVAHLVARAVEEVRTRQMRQRKLNIGERPYVALYYLLDRHIVPALRISPCNAIRVYRSIVCRHEIKIGTKTHAARLFKRGDLGWMRKYGFKRETFSMCDTFMSVIICQQCHGI